MPNTVDESNINDTIKSWVQTYTDSLYSFALYKTSSKEIAEDLVQETFLAALQSFNNYEGRSNPKTWLIAILRNKINDYHRINFKNPTLMDSSIYDAFFNENGVWNKGQFPSKWQDSTEHLLDNPDFIKVFQDCMQDLPPNWISAIQLRYLHEKKGEIICQELNISPTNYWKIIQRAKLLLRKCIELGWFIK